MNHSNFRVTALGFRNFLETDINQVAQPSRNHSPSRASRMGVSAKPPTAHSSTRTSSRERSELVKFDQVKDKVLPKFTAKVIMDVKLKYKSRKMNSLAMMGILPPKPRKKGYDDVSESDLFQSAKKEKKENASPKKEEVPAEKTLKFKDAPEFPPRYGARFGTTLNIKKIRQNADNFNAQSRDFISTMKGQNKLGYFTQSQQSPLRKAGETVLSSKPHTTQDSFHPEEDQTLPSLAANYHSASASNLRSGKFTSNDSLKTLSKIKHVISVARQPTKLLKISTEPHHIE